MRLYERRLFEPLLRDEDVLTNMHVNTTILEIYSAARAYEVTGGGPLPQDRGGILGYGHHAPQHVRYRRPDFWRTMDAHGHTGCASGRQKSGALRCVQHNPPGGLSVPLEQRKGIRRLHRAKSVEWTSRWSLIRASTGRTERTRKRSSNPLTNAAGRNDCQTGAPIISPSILHSNLCIRSAKKPIQFIFRLKTHKHRPNAEQKKGTLLC